MENTPTSLADPTFEARKRDHIQAALSPANQAYGLTGLEDVRLEHDALPELDFAEVSLEASCLGKKRATPFYIAGMTAGHEDAKKLNAVLARSCMRRGWALGLGSQRRDFLSLDPSLSEWTEFRGSFPSLQVFANIGASQLVSGSLAQVQSGLESLVELTMADALCVHLNVLQEVMQPEGTPQFAGLVGRLESLSKTLTVPLVLKETGCGFSRSTLAKLRGVKLAAIDASGLGGTHWGRIEGERAAKKGDARLQTQASQTFAEWGVPTVQSVRNCVAAQVASEVWASGGVRSGLDAAKLLALGASQVGFAKPALEAALHGEAALEAWMQQIEFELRTALFCTGSKTVGQVFGKFA